MKNFDIEAYIEGNLKGAELADFEKELAENSRFKTEVEEYRQTQNDLQDFVVWNEIQEALTSDPAVPTEQKPGAKKSGIDRRWFYLFMLTASAIFYFAFLKTSNTPPITEPETIPSFDVETEELPDFDADKKPVKKIKPTFPAPNQAPKLEQAKKQKFTPPPPSNNRPSKIADNTTPDKLNPDDIPNSGIRGEDTSSKTSGAFSVDSIWHSVFPPKGVVFETPFTEAAKLLTDKDFMLAYVKLQMLERQFPENDTLIFLKGYCLTEMREGSESLRYFDKLKIKNSDWQESIEWCRALDLVLTGEREKAKAAFAKMAQNKGHIFQAKK